MTHPTKWREFFNVLAGLVYAFFRPILQYSDSAFFKRDPEIPRYLQWTVEFRKYYARLCVLSHYSRVRLCDPMDCSPPGSSVQYSRQEYWSGLPCLPPGGLSNPGSNWQLLHLLHWQSGSLPLAPPEKPIMLMPTFFFSWIWCCKLFS